MKKTSPRKINKKYNSIKRQLILKNLMMIVIMCIVFSTSSYSLSKKALLDNSELMLQQLAISTSSQIEESLMRYVDVAQTLAQDKALTTEKVYMRDKLAVLTRNHMLFNHNSVGVVDSNGECRDTNGVVIDVDKEEYFQRAMNGETYISTPYIARDTGELEIVYAVPIREIDEDTGENINSKAEDKMQFGEVKGVLVIKRPGSDYTDIANSVRFGETGTTQIIDQYGTIIAHENPVLVKEHYNLIQDDVVDPVLYGLQEIHKKMFDAPKGIGKYQDDKIEKTLAYAPIEFTDWVVGISIDTNELLEQVPVLTMWLLVSAIGCMILGVIIAIIIANGIVNKLKKIKENVMKLAQGDFTKVIQNYSVNDEITDISDAIEKTKEDIVGIIENIKNSSNHLDKEYINLLKVAKEFTQVSESISVAVQQASEGSKYQSNDLNSVNEKFIVFNEKITKSVEQIEDISISSDTIYDRAGKSNYDMARLSDSMNGISNSFDGVEASIKAMKISMDRVAKITNIINSITDQTNLLSLNATIEAARAGEAGKGFSVVAGEIRKLSQQSQQALEKIHSAVFDTIHETEMIIQKTDIMKEHLKDGEIDVNQGIRSFNVIADLVIEMVPKIKEISENTRQIVEDQKDITLSIENSNNISQEISGTTEEITSSIGDLVLSSSEVENVAKRLSVYTVQMRKATAEFTI